MEIYVWCDALGCDFQECTDTWPRAEKIKLKHESQGAPHRCFFNRAETMNPHGDTTDPAIRF